MKIEEIKNLAEEIHKGNVQRGFWDEARPMSELLVLIRTEIDEAVEADRKGNLCYIGEYGELGCTRKETYEQLIEDCGFSTDIFKQYIKDTVEDELADTVIRILDLSASGAINEKYFFMHFGYIEIYDYSLFCFFTDFVDEFHEIMPSRNTTKKYQTYCLAEALTLVIGYCENVGIDIWWHVKEKLKYNATRPYKHGKKY